MRHVSFVDFVEFDFEGNVMSKALVMGDVDNDNNNEIALGTTNGDLFIYKGIQRTKPWAKASDLGMIACLEIGDLCNQGLNCLVSLGTEGWCHIFYLNSDWVVCPAYAQDSDVGLEATESAADSCNTTDTLINTITSLSFDSQQQSQQQQQSASFQQSFATSQQLPQQTHMLKPAYTQRLSSNCKACVIADIDGDGNNELIVSFTDRVVRSFKWMPDIPAAGNTQISSSSSGKQLAAATTTQDSKQQAANTHGVQGNPQNVNSAFGALVLVEKWKLAGQVGSMTANKKSDGRTEVLVSQPGGSYVTLICSSDDNDISDAGTGGPNANNKNGGNGNKPCSGTSICYHPLGSARARNPNVTTEIISNLRRNTTRSAAAAAGGGGSGGGGGWGGGGSDTGGYSAICTLDGTLTLIDDDTISWSLYVDHQLFSLTKMDITGDGTEEVVACSWDGHTYIVNLSKEVVRFHFKDNVAAFTSGTYHESYGKSTTALCYATFNNKLVVYYNISLSNIGMCDLITKVLNDVSLVEALMARDVDVNDRSKLKAYIGQLLYNPKPIFTS